MVVWFVLLIKYFVCFYGSELQGYKEALSIPVAKPGRRLYSVRDGADCPGSVVVQIDATEGNKVITVRSPLQVKTNPRPQPLTALLFQCHLPFLPYGISSRSYFSKMLLKSHLLTILLCLLHAFSFGFSFPVWLSNILRFGDAFYATWHFKHVFQFLRLRVFSYTCVLRQLKSVF